MPIKRKTKPKLVNVRFGTIWIAVDTDKRRQGLHVNITGLPRSELQRLNRAAKLGKLLVDRIDSK